MMNSNKMGKPGLLKAINRNRIMRLVIQNQEVSRASLANETSLALPSVMRLVDGLIDEGWLIDIGKGTSSGGRKPNLLALNKTKHYIIGVEIALVTTVVLTDLSGDVVDRWQSKEDHEITPESVMTQILEVINQFIEKHQLKTDIISGIGIGSPGSQFKHKRLISNSILKGWESIDVKEWFEEKTSIPIYVDNVARTKTLNALWFGEGRGKNNFIYVLVDQGVGCGIVKNGQIIEGANGVAGEFGHMIISVDGKPCYCGSDGCLEMYISTGALLNTFNEASEDPINTFDEILPTLGDNKLLVESTGKYLGVAVSNLINLLNPEIIIIGGRVIEVSESFRKRVISYTKDNIFSDLANQTKVIFSGENYQEVTRGGVALVYNELFKLIL